jgi:flagellar motor switch protein FliN/FliY
VDDLSPEEVDSLSKAMGDEATAVEDPPEPESSEKAVSEQHAPPEPEHDLEETPSSDPSISRAQFMQLEELAAASNLPPLELQRMADIKVKVKVLLGSTKLPLEKILEFNPGKVVELDRLAGEPVDIFANDRHIARAEVVILNDNFGVKILEITGTEQKLKVVEK